MGSFVIYEGDHHDFDALGTKVKTLETGRQLFEFDGRKINVVVDGSKISIELGVSSDTDNLGIMLGGNWRWGDELKKLGLDAITLAPETTKSWSVALLDQEDGTKWRAIRFEGEQ